MGVHTEGIEMSSVQTPVSDMLVTVKSREVQRGMLAEMGNRQTEARTHFLAAAHLELVLADDYERGGTPTWRAGAASAQRPVSGVPATTTGREPCSTT